jgi:hypothetical protein
MRHHAQALIMPCRSTSSKAPMIKGRTNRRFTLVTAAPCPRGARCKGMSSTALDTDARAHFAHRVASKPDSCANQPGCGVTYQDKQSYGPTFNKVGGGYYVLERTETDIKMWFFLRNGWAPDSVKNPTDTIDTSSFPTPNAWFPNTKCDLNKHFAAHNIIINLTLCGEAFSHPGSGARV